MSIIRFIQFVIIVNAVGLILQSVRVIATYSAVYTLTKDHHRRQLPLHVWVIALSYLIYVISTTYFLYVNGETVQVLPRTILFGASGVLGQYALWNVLKYDRRRYSQATNFMDSDDAPS